MKVGVVALQGGFVEHINILHQLGAIACPVRLATELLGLDGLIIPGGESTTISKLMQDFNLISPIIELAQRGLPILGSCAGMILLAKEIDDDEVETLRLMDMRVKRNAFGSQEDSFEADLAIPALGKEPFPAVFIRAPAAKSVWGEAEILARLPDDTIVAVEERNLIAVAFHPELTADLRLHQYFLGRVNMTLSGYS
jgi:5'-phosphate synthase pdxT subunit